MSLVCMASHRLITKSHFFEGYLMRSLHNTYIKEKSMTCQVVLVKLYDFLSYGNSSQGLMLQESLGLLKMLKFVCATFVKCLNATFVVFNI